MAEGAWHLDPTARHHLRWHDGHNWTDQVHDDGQTRVDPIDAPPPAAVKSRKAGRKAASGEKRRRETLAAAEKAARKAKRASPTATGSTVLFGKGSNGQLEATEDWITIYRKGAMAKMTQGYTKGVKRIAVGAVNAVQVKKPGVTVGYIQFTLGGGIESRRGVLDATKDENTVTFRSNHASSFYEIRDFIEAAIGRRHAQPTEPRRIREYQSAFGAPLSVADELRKLASLRDDGVLSEQEFAQEKTRLLGY